MTQPTAFKHEMVKITSFFRLAIVAKHPLIILLIWLLQFKLLSFVTPISLNFDACSNFIFAANFDNQY